MGYHDDQRTTKPKSRSFMMIIIALVGALVIGVGGFFLTWLFFMHTETVEPGHELVINDKPYFFGHEGVRPETVKEGRVLLFATSSVQSINMQPAAVSVAIDDFSSSDNILLDFETTIQYRYTSAVDLVVNFGDKWFENNIQRQYLAIVRDAVKKYTMTQMMSDQQTATDMDVFITAELQKLVRDSKLPIEILGVSLGRAKPNSTVLNQMNETAAQQQREKTMVAAKKAEDARKEAEGARADADNQYRNKIGLDAAQFIQLEQAKLYSSACAKQGATCIVTTGTQPLVVGPK